LQLFAAPSLELHYHASGAVRTILSYAAGLSTQCDGPVNFRNSNVFARAEDPAATKSDAAAQGWRAQGHNEKQQ